MTCKRIRCWSTGLLAIAAVPVWAQEAAPGGAELQEIVVTAQRREESAQKTSLAMEVLSQDAINKAGVSDPASIANLVSGVNIGFGGSTVQTFIRGVGSFVTNSFADSAIAYNIDGVYISRPPAISGSFYDLQRIEVLKGPQGTLYGRNASGGAINLITVKPSHELGGTLSAEVGDYDLIKVSGAMNVPVSDVLAFRAAFQSNEHDGYGGGGYYDEDTRAARLHALFTPNEDFSLLLTGDLAHIGGKGPIGVRIGAGDSSTDDPWRDRVASAPAGQPAYHSPVPWANQLNVPDNSGFIDTHLWNTNAQLDWNLHWATLTVIPAFRNMESSTRTFQPGFLFDNHETSRQKTIEARLGNSTDKLKWVGGGYYFREHQTQFFYVDQGVNVASVNTPKLDTDSWAAFGETTYSFRPELRAIVGARYTYEKKELAGQQWNTTPYPTFVRDYALPGQVPSFLLSSGSYDCVSPLPPFPHPSVCELPVSGKTSGNKVTWKTGLEYDLTPQSMLFVTASEGYKAGGLFSTKQADPRYKPEELLAFELGSRNRFFNNRLQVNFEGFYWKYRDKQEASVRFDPVDGVSFIIRNASKATMYGANLDLAFQATTHDRIDAGAEYLHSQYDDFQYVLTMAGTSGCIETPRSDGNFNIDCTGKQLPKAPQWSGKLGYAHIFDLPNDATVTAAVREQYSSPTVLDITYAPTARMGSWSVVDADLTYDSPKKWSVTGWIRNIGNKAVYTGGSLYPFTPGVYYATIRPPRTFGARVSVSF